MKIELVDVSRRPQWPLWAILIVLVWLALGGTALWLNSQFQRPVTLCIFKQVTGLPCPTCGFARGALCFLRGRPDQTLLYNPLLFSVLGLFVAAIGMRILFARSLRFRLSSNERIVIWVLATIMLAANWIYVILYTG